MSDYLIQEGVIMKKFPNKGVISCRSTFGPGVGKQSNCGANKEAAAAAAAASVAVWSAYRTTLLGISLRLWIWLRGIDRFLSRQM